MLLRSDKSLQAQSLCEQFGSFITNLFEKWTGLEALFADGDNDADASDGGLAIAIAIASKMCAWHQQLKSPVAESILPPPGRDKYRLAIKHFLHFLCGEEHLGKSQSQLAASVSASGSAGKGGWELLLLSNIMSVEKALESSGKKSDMFNINKLLTDLKSKTFSSEVEKDLLGMLFLAVVDYDVVKQCHCSTGNNVAAVTFNAVKLFHSIFYASMDDVNVVQCKVVNLDVDADSFNILVLCLRHLLLAESDSPAPQEAALSTAFYLQFCMTALQQVTTNLTWSSLLRSSVVDSTLKLLANLLIQATAATSLPLSTPHFQEDYCFPFFSAVSNFVKTLIDLFCSEAEEGDCEQTHLSSLPAMFVTLGEVLSILMHTCFKLGVVDYHAADSLELMDNAVVVFDIINIGSDEKQLLSKQYARYVFRFCTGAAPIPAEYLSSLLVAAPGGPQWSSDVRKLSHCLTSRQPSSFLMSSCRHDAVDFYMQLIRASAGGLMTEKRGSDSDRDGEREGGSGCDPLEWAESLSGGLRLLLRESSSGSSSSSCHNMSVLNCLTLSLKSIFVWSVDSSSSFSSSSSSSQQQQQQASCHPCHDETIVTELKQNLIFVNDGTCTDTNIAGSKRGTGKSSKKCKAEKLSPDSTSERIVLLCKFKTSILLLQWTFSLTSASEKAEKVSGEENSSSAGGGAGTGRAAAEGGSGGTESSTVSQIPGFQVVAVAFRLWRELLTLGAAASEGVSRKSASMFVDFFGDTYLLFFFLGMYGSVNDQVC